MGNCHSFFESGEMLSGFISRLLGFVPHLLDLGDDSIGTSDCRQVGELLDFIGSSAKHVTEHIEIWLG
jgi:hypothetical protein